MAESGMFRSSLHGFNRQDVLRYIEELQAANSEREESLSAQLEAALSEAETLRSEASSLRASSEETAAHAAELEALVEEHNRTNRVLREQAAQYTAAAEELKTTAQALEVAQKEAEEGARAKEQLAEATTRGERLAVRCRALEQENARLNALLGAVRRQTEQLRLHGQSFVAASCKYSDDRLTSLEETLAVLERRLGETREQIGSERARLAEQVDTAGIRLQELIHTIETGELSAGTATAPVAADAQSDSDVHFFRSAATVRED